MNGHVSNVDFAMGLDSDGDGLPDWWEWQYGLDPHEPDDVHRDISGDGLTIRQAYEMGADPTVRYRRVMLGLPEHSREQPER